MITVYQIRDSRVYRAALERWRLCVRLGEVFRELGRVVRER